jgi:hypothetical protein
MSLYPELLMKTAGIQYSPVGLYDAPDPASFGDVVSPEAGKWRCLFDFFPQWIEGKTLLLTAENHGCGGCGHWLFGLEGRSRQDFIEFLVDQEGLKASHELMDQWLDVRKPYGPQHDNILVGPLQDGQNQYLKSVTFFVNPDQLGLMMLGTQYFHAPGDPTPVLAPFGSGCMEMLPLFDDLNIPQAIIGATDIAMRGYLPPDILAFTVTVPMARQLCRLDERSFLSKPFWKNLQKARLS